MDWLTQRLYPQNPKRVRQRKFQSLCFAIFLGAVACVLVALAVYFMGKPQFTR